jgi:hypothetical protein
MRRIRSGKLAGADNGADEFSFFDVRPGEPFPAVPLIVAGALVLAIGASAGALLLTWVLP